MVVNIPVRLVRADGGLIALDVTTLTLDVDRNINPHAVPYGGSARWAFDLNLSKAVILLEGYVVDSPDTIDVTAGQAAYSSIDFSKSTGVTTFRVSDVEWVNQSLTLNTASRLTTDTINTINPYITISNSADTSFKIYFSKSNTTQGLIGGEYHVSMVDASGNMRTTTEIVGYLYTLINLNTGSTVLGAHFLATVNTSTITINQLVNGKAGNTFTPIFEGNARVAPYIEMFLGGSDTDITQSMSAGDKVMSLYATLNNSVDKDNTDKVWGDRESGAKKQVADYITGIQIPFNSTYNADGEKYKAMNFFMPTGANMIATDKDISNAEPASSIILDPDADDDFSFIKGTITKATFVQIGGEPIYQFNIQFLPIDTII